MLHYTLGANLGNLFMNQAYESETAGVIAMLCTPDAAYTTGSVISCNGGFKFSV